MTSDDNWNPDEKSDVGDLNNFTNVANPVNPPNSSSNSNVQNKSTPPPPPPPRHTTDTNIIPNAPPEYVSFNDNGFSNDTGMNINLDKDIRDKISRFSNYGQGTMTYDDNSETPYYSYNDNDNVNTLDQPTEDYERKYEENYIYNENKVDIYTDIEKMIKTSPFGIDNIDEDNEEQDDKDVSVLLPLRYDLYESYFAPLLMIFSQIPKFSNIILHHEYLTFPYKPNWWNRELCSENPSFVQELQRLVAFLNGDSKRRFASLFNLIKPFEKLVKDEFESIDEFVGFAINEIVELISSIEYSSKDPIKQLFASTCIQNNDLANKRDIYDIPFNSDELCYNIYQTVYNKLNTDEDVVYLSNVSDILTFSFESDTKTIEEGFSLEEFIFPQIFLYENRDVFMSIDNKIEELRMKNKELLDKSFKMRAFNGKSIRGILTETKKYLHSESEKLKVLKDGDNDDDTEMKDADSTNKSTELKDYEKYESASENIGSLATNIQQLITQITEETNNIQRNISNLKSKKFEIDEILNEEQKSTFEPWILTGIIINPAVFCYREKKSNNWISVGINQDTCKDYYTSEIELSEIQQMMQEYTSKNLDDGFILTYVRKSVFFDCEFNPLNKLLEEFINKDNAHLQKQFDIMKGGV